MKQLTDSLLITLILSVFVSCGCPEPDFLVDGSTFAFRLVDESTGDDIFLDRFNPFAFEIIDDESDTVDIDDQRYGQNGRNAFFLDPTGGQSFRYDVQDRRRYFLYFDSTDVDTLTLFFVPRADDSDCGQEYMDDFEAYYNDELVLTGSGESWYDAEAISKP